MARSGRGDSTRETGGHIPLVATIAEGRLQAERITIADGMGISRGV
jgi:hypothetical protein